MEKYLRLLNPKSLNYQSIRVDNNSVSITVEDVLLAMSYAQLTKFEDALIRLKYLGANTLENIEKFCLVLVKKYQDYFDIHDLKQKYHLVVAKVALIEFCAVAAWYSPTVRNRAVLAGCSSTVVQNQLKGFIDMILNDLKHCCADGEDKVFTQLYKSK